MNESQTTAKINRYLPPEVYAWKIHDSYHRGIPDCYYSGPSGDLWIEFKHYPAGIPGVFKPRLTEHQIQWLNARHDEGRRVAVVVTDAKHALVITDKQWNTRVTRTTTYTHKELATYIAEKVCAC